MKKSLLSILIALVLIVALLPIVASADPATAGVNINGTVQTATQGEAALYFTTDNAGAITAGGDEDTYNIKFVYPEGTDAVPTVYLRGAYIATVIKSDATSAATTKIVVEDTTAGKVTTAGGDIEADTYMTAGITWSAGHGDLVIEGPGKLSMNIQSNAIIANGALTFNNLELDLVTTGGAYRYAFGGTPTSITFNGGDYSVSVAGLALNHQVNIVVNNADVYMTSAGQTLYSSADGLVTLNGGSFKVESTTTAKEPATRKCNFVVNAGVLELISPYAASNSEYKANFSNYNGNPVGSAVWTDGRVFSYRGGNLSWYKYVKIEPGYAVNVTDGFAFLYDNADNNQSAALEGQTVGLSCEGSSETYEFLGWVVNEGSTEVTINNADQPKASFVMPAGNVSVTAKYKKLVKDSAILIDDVPYSVDQGADPLYFTTGDDGIVTAGGDANNYNVKFEYPAGADAAVLSLKGAKISSTIKSDEGADNTRIVVETDSSLVNTTITWKHSDLTVEGPGKLTIASNKTAFSISGYSIIFKNADVTANFEGEWHYLIGGTPVNVVFDGGKYYSKAVTSSIFITDKDAALVGLEVKGNAEVIIEGGSPLYIDNPHFGVTVQSGTLVLRNTTGSGNAFRLKSEKFVINGGTVELDGSMASYPYTIVPDLSGYQGNYTAVTGEKNGLIPYDPEDGLAQGVDGSYRGYWKIEPAEAGHQCSLKMVKGKAATCTTAGEKFYYGCEECGAAYEDILGEKLIEDLATWKVIPAFGHTDDDKDGKCDTCETTISSGNSGTGNSGTGNSGTGNGSVQTSDSSFTALWIVALTLSAMGICVTFIYNKKMKAA